MDNIRNVNTSTVTTVGGDKRSMGRHRDSKITKVDENKKITKKITTKNGEENVRREDKRKYFITKVSKEQKMITTEHGDEQCGWEEDINYTSKVTTEHGDTQNMGEGSNAKITSADNTGIEVTT